MEDNNQPPQPLHGSTPHTEEPHHDEHVHVSNKPIVITLVLLGIFFLGGIFYFTANPHSGPANQIADQATVSPTPTQIPVTWEFDGNAWKSSATPPTCAEPVTLQPPVDTSLVSAVLYPGQIRDEDYKPHGGFTFTGRANSEIIVRAPMDGRLVSGSRYVDQGEVQYLLFFINDCGIAYRFDHLLTIAPQFQPLVATLPEPNENNTLIPFASPSAVKKGDAVATAVGFQNTQNVTVDFGVYDLRKPNPQASEAGFMQFHAAKKEQAYYALCWLDLYPADQIATIKNIPSANTLIGKASDFCK